MVLSSWSTRKPSRAKRGRGRLGCERLEDRTVPSTLWVSNTLDSGAGSLRDTIKHANSGDIIRFEPSLDGQTIMLTKGEIAITKSLDIEGPGAGLLAVSGTNQSRVFDISQDHDKPTVAVTIAGLTIEGGLSSSGNGGGILNRGSTLTLTNDILCNNIANGKSTPDHSATGGAITNEYGGALIVSGCRFSGNRAVASGTGTGVGGAIDNLGFLFGATATVNNSTFTGNVAQGGDGGNADNGLSFHGLGLGGAIMNDVNATLSVSVSTFVGNEAHGGSNIAGSAADTRLGNGDGGGLLDVGVATVTNCTFTGNKALGGNNNTGGAGVQWMGNGIGGGIATNVFPGGGFPQSLTVTGCTFTNDQAVGGAGNVGGVVTGFGFGGGLATFLGATATVMDGTFCGNLALGGVGGTGWSGGEGLGGGIAVFAGSSLTVSNCTLSANQAVGGTGGTGGDGGNGLGGGVYDDGPSTLTITGSTIRGNLATGGAGGSGGLFGLGEGGGLFIDSGATVYLDAFTVGHTTGNSPDDVVGLYFLI
jgi:hypothetical protein